MVPILIHFSWKKNLLMRSKLRFYIPKHPNFWFISHIGKSFETIQNGHIATSLATGFGWLTKTVWALVGSQSPLKILGLRQLKRHQRVRIIHQNLPSDCFLQQFWNHKIFPTVNFQPIKIIPLSSLEHSQMLLQKKHFVILKYQPHLASI